MVLLMFLLLTKVFFSDSGHIFVGPTDIPLAVPDVRLPRKYIYLFVLSLRVLPSEFVTLHLSEMHYETHKLIIICNDGYKFVAYPHNILQKFVVKNVIMVRIHSKRFLLM